MRKLEYYLLPESGYNGDYERKEKHDMFKVSVMADNLITAKIYVYEKIDVIMMKLKYKNNLLIEEAENCFDAMTAIRKRLEAQGEKLVCMGACRNVYPSAMCLNMGYGEHAYKLELGCKARMKDLISIFEMCSPENCGTVEEQEAYYESWLKSL